MKSKARTVAQYLAELPAERRAIVEAVRRVIRDNLDADYEEGMQYGMIGYYVPHRVFPQGYHCDPRQPLPFAALASQKSHLSLYLMGLYCNQRESEWFRQAWTKSGKKLDMGKSCVRFKSLDQLALDVIGQAIRRVPARTYIRLYQEGLMLSSSATKSGAKATAKSKPLASGKPAAAMRKAAPAGKRAARASRKRKP